MNSQGDLGFLKVLTENPELMQKAMSIASSLASSGALSGLGLFGGDQSNQPKEKPSPQPPNTANTGDLSALFSALGANSNQSIQKPIQVHEEKKESEHENSHAHKANHKDRIKLLEAMRPFVPDEKREKLEFVIRLLGLIQVADQLGIKNMIEGR